LTEIADTQWNRIQREVSAFRGLIDIWDVVNEAVVMPDFDPAKYQIARLCADVGQVELIKRAFACARSANPAATCGHALPYSCHRWLASPAGATSGRNARPTLVRK
jgi:hypothetical protein